MGVAVEIGMGVAQTEGWNPLRIGAGGWITGIDVASDGEKVVRADTYGAYRWNSSTEQWDQLVTATRIGEESYIFRGAMTPGVYEISIAPSNTQRYYMVWDGYVYRTDNRGVSWTKTAFSRNTSLNPNGGTRMYGQKMAVDPADEDTVYLGAGSAGVWYTHDAGATWTQIPTGTIPFGTDHAGIAFDSSGGTDGNGYTNNIIATSYGLGVYRTTNAGTDWSDITSGGPVNVIHAVVVGGVYFCTDKNDIWKYDAGWTDIMSVWSRNAYAVAIDPDDSTHIMGFDDGSVLTESTNGGSSWYTPYWPPSRSATDIPWLEWTSETYMTLGDVRVDQSDKNMYFAQGIGVWRSPFPTTAPPSDFTWTSQSKGIEQLVANWIWSVPGGAVFVTSWDRPLFKSVDQDVFPSTHGPNRDHSIIYGASVEHARDDATFLVVAAGWGSNEESSYSSDSGATWTKFASTPAGWSSPGRGHIAVKTTTNWVWTGVPTKAPYYTTDGGSTWTACPDPVNVSTDNQQYSNRHVVCTDGTYFYLYLSIAGTVGVYRSSTGASWTLMSESGTYLTTYNYDYWNGKLKAVPGQTGHLFWCTGTVGSGDHAGPDSSAYFRRSTDGGATWTTVSNVAEVYDFGFGKEKTGESYPAIFVVGYVNSVFGVWMSDDNCSTWTRLGNTPWPLGSLDEIKCCSGDMNTYGRCYIGFIGSGWAYWG